MKVAHILNKIEFSGAETMLFQASDMFAANGVETTLVASEIEPGRFEPSMREAGYKIDNVGAASSLKFLKNFYNYFSSHQFDVVHIHTEKLYLWKVVLLRLSGHRNIVRTFHNCWTFGGYIRLKLILHRRLATYLGVKKHAIGDAVLANESKMFLNKCYQINNWILTDNQLIKNQVAIRREKRKELGIPEDNFVIISVGGCSSVKNHGFILELVNNLVEQGLKITYLHAGTGVDEPAEKQSASQLGIDTQVIFAGNRKDIPELLIGSDVYMMPSLFEGLSIALLEAMYYNGLVIVNNAPGLNNIVDNNKTGFVIDISDNTIYLELLKSLIGGNTPVAVIREEARRFIGDKFSLENNVGELLKYYKLNTNIK